MSDRNYLLDASALLALIRNEPGADRVRDVLDDSQIHAVNLAEVAKKMVSMGIPAAEVEKHLAALSLEVIEQLSAEQAMAIGRLGIEAKRLGLSIGDCGCLIIALWNGSVAVTTERRWSEVAGIDVKILQIRSGRSTQ